MRRARPILGFLCRFVIVLGLLAAPWPGWPETYARCLQKGATAVYGSFGSKGIVEFAPDTSGDKTCDTVICVRNREKPDASHSRRSVFSSRITAYFPTALVIALVLATGIGWRRRLCALAWGLVWIHVFIAFLLGLMIATIICAFPELELFKVSSFWRELVLLLGKLFLTYQNAFCAVAFLIWMVVTFRRDDWIKILGQEGAGAGQQGKSPTTGNAH